MVFMAAVSLVALDGGGTDGDCMSDAGLGLMTVVAVVVEWLDSITVIILSGADSVLLGTGSNMSLKVFDSDIRCVVNSLWLASGMSGIEGGKAYVRAASSLNKSWH